MSNPFYVLDDTGTYSCLRKKCVFTLIINNMTIQVNSVYLVINVARCEKHDNSVNVF